MSRQQTELLSAYLDDELRPAERGKVEVLLTENAEAQAQLEALRRTTQNLRTLPRQAPPPTLDVRNLRRLAALQERERGLAGLLENHLPGMGRQSSLLLLFALVVSFGLAMYSFSYSQWRDPREMLPVVLDPPPELQAQVTKPEDYRDGQTAFVSGKIFQREGKVWYQEGLSDRTEARPVTLDGGEGRRLLAKRPDLRGITQLGEVVLEVNGEILRLIPADRPLGGL